VRDRFPWILSAIYAVIFTALGAVRYNVHRNLVDFGIFEQTIASSFGCFCNTIEGSHWAFHFSPILYLSGALIALWKSPYVLIALQTVSCALVIPPVYALANKSKLAAVVVFLYPPLAGLAFGDFHENSFAPAAIAWAIWAFDSGALVVALIAALVAICVKEDQAIFLAAAGGWAAWRYRGSQRAVAAIIAVVGVVVATTFFFAIQPHAAANPHWSPTRFYAWTNADLAQFFPGGVLGRIGFFALAFLPLLFLPFRTRAGWLLLLPLAEVLLSRMPTTYNMSSHYAGEWAGYALVAFAIGARSLDVVRLQPMLWTCISFCLVELAVANPMHTGLNVRAVQPRDRALDATIASLPKDASVATQEEAFTHLGLTDENATLLPEDPSISVTSCFVLIDRDFPDSPRLQEYAAALPSTKRGISLLHARGQCP
jgi:uncharacterized membrane protein